VLGLPPPAYQLHCMSPAIRTTAENNYTTTTTIWGHKIQKKIKKPRKSDISTICPDAPTGVISLNCGVWNDIADVITRAKFLF